MDKEYVVCIYDGILFSHKKEWNNAICSNMDATTDNDTNKWSKSERERQIPYDTTFMWSLKYSRNELVYKTESDSQTENRLVLAKRREGEG